MQRAKVSYNLKTFFWHSAFKRVEFWRRRCRVEKDRLALGQHFFNFRPCFGSPGSQFVFFFDPMCFADTPPLSPRTDLSRALALETVFNYISGRFKWQELLICFFFRCAGRKKGVKRRSSGQEDGSWCHKREGFNGNQLWRWLLEIKGDSTISVGVQTDCKRYGSAKIRRR